MISWALIYELCLKKKSLGVWKEAARKCLLPDESILRSIRQKLSLSMETWKIKNLQMFYIKAW